MCLSYGENQLWVGDKTGLIHLFDTYSGTFELVQVNGHFIGSQLIFIIFLNLGSLKTSLSILPSGSLAK